MESSTAAATSPSTYASASGRLDMNENEPIAKRVATAAAAAVASTDMNMTFKNPNSIESMVVPSPAGSLEQFEIINTPLSVDESSNTSFNLEPGSSTSLNQTLNNNNINNNSGSAGNNGSSASTIGAFGSNGSANFGSSKSFDPSSPSFRFRRHSSQSSLNLPLSLNLNNNGNGNGGTGVANSATSSASTPAGLVSPLTLTPSNSNAQFNCSTSLTTSERVCSSPINSLKMSSRVCQIKIDEGIEPHLSREIKSERETQNTLKLKTSCDELMINNDELESLTFDRNMMEGNGRNANSPNSFLNGASSSAPNGVTFRRYRTFSESFNNTVNNVNTNGAATSVPSPSMSSGYSYSNSSSPTGGIPALPATSGLLRCYSPSTTNGASSGLSQSNLNQNYFSQSPSPTRKLFVTRRSMSPVPCCIRPSTLNANISGSNKRKFSDVEQQDLNSPSLLSIQAHSPKRSNLDSQPEFVQPLLIFTGQQKSARSGTSSPSPFMMTNVSNSSTQGESPGQSPSTSTSLIITAFNSADKSSTDGATTADSALGAVTSESKLKVDSKFIRPTLNPIRRRTDDDQSNVNRYTFVPIQLPPPTPLNSSTNNGQTVANIPPHQLIIQNKRINQVSGLIASSSSSFSSNPSSSTSTTSSSFSSLAQLTLQNNLNNSPSSPAQYFCDSPGNYSPSIISSSSIGDKPDSGYQSSVQNNSDSETCS